MNTLHSRAELRGRFPALCFCLLLLLSGGAQAADKASIDKQVVGAVKTFRAQPWAAQLMDKAQGVLVFPSVVEMGFGIGGEYGEGVLLVDGETQAYYSSAGSSFGLQVGAQSKAQLVLFMTRSDLRDFRSSETWEAGVDGAITRATLDDSGALDASVAQADIIGFVFSNSGFMYNLSLEGIRITPIQR